MSPPIVFAGTGDQAWGLGEGNAVMVSLWVSGTIPLALDAVANGNMSDAFTPTTGVQWYNWVPQSAITYGPGNLPAALAAGSFVFDPDYGNIGDIKLAGIHYTGSGGFVNFINPQRRCVLPKAATQMTVQIVPTERYTVEIEDEEEGYSWFVGDAEALSGSPVPVTVDLPAGARHVMVVIVLDNDGTARTWVSEFSTIAYPPSSTSLVNLTGMAIGTHTTVYEDASEDEVPSRLTIARRTEGSSFILENVSPFSLGAGGHVTYPHTASMLPLSAREEAPPILLTADRTYNSLFADFVKEGMGGPEDYVPYGGSATFAANEILVMGRFVRTSDWQFSGIAITIRDPLRRLIGLGPRSFRAAGSWVGREFWRPWLGEEGPP